MKQLFYFIILVILTACSPDKPTIKVNERNLKLVTINYSFPFLDVDKFISSNDTLALVCPDCKRINEDNKGPLYYSEYL